VSAGKKKVKEDEERSHNELRQIFIDKYRTGHFDSIKSVKKVIKECQKLLKEAENPREKKRLESLIKVTDKQLLNLRNRTPQVLKNSNRMQRQLDSLRERG
jgi:phage shock protein A